MKKYKQYYGGVYNYPVNTRLCERLADLEQTPAQYFGVVAESTAGKFADRLYTHFYSASIGLEDLDVFDLKIKSDFNTLIEAYGPIYDTRETFLKNASDLTQGGEKVTYDETYGKGTDTTRTNTTTHGKKTTFDTQHYQTVEEDITQESGTTSDNSTETQSGADTHSGSVTRETSLKGNASYIKELYELTENIFAEFNEHFNYLFMGVL